MKKIQKSTLLLIAALLINTFVFAQIDVDPADLGGDGTANPLDENSSPIDGNLWILVVVGLVYMFIKFKTYLEKPLEKVDFKNINTESECLN